MSLVLYSFILDRSIFWIVRVYDFNIVKQVRLVS